MLGTIKRTGEALDLFSAQRPEWGVTEVARALEVPKSNAHALLSSLADIGVLQRTAAGRYRLGWRILAMGRVLVQGADFRPHAARAARGLIDRFGETVHVAAWDGGHAVCVGAGIGTHDAPVAVAGVGARLPAHCTGVGKTLLAHRSAVELRRTLDERGLAAATPNTIRDADRLREELASVRRHELARDHEEAVAGVACVAAPLRDPAGEVIAAISIAAPAFRMRRHGSAYAEGLQEAAADVQLALCAA